MLLAEAHNRHQPAIFRLNLAKYLPLMERSHSKLSVGPTITFASAIAYPEWKKKKKAQMKKTRYRCLGSAAKTLIKQLRPKATKMYNLT